MNQTYHLHLRDRVVQTQAAFEAAKSALQDYENFHGTEISVIASAPVAPATPAKTSTKAPAKAASTAKEPAKAKGDFLVNSDGTPVLNKDGTPRKKPGPAKGTPVATRAASSKKASESVKAKKIATKGTNGKAAHNKPGPKPGSLKKGGKPSLINAIQMVMGGKTMNADLVFEALKAKGWLPESSDPKGYVRYTLSSKKNIFLRVPSKRGFYHLESKKAVKETAAPAEETTTEETTETAETAAPESTETVVETKPAAEKAVPKAPKSAPKASDPMAEVDDILSGAGIDLTASNPFAAPTGG